MTEFYDSVMPPSLAQRFFGGDASVGNMRSHPEHDH